MYFNQQNYQPQNYQPQNYQPPKKKKSLWKAIGLLFLSYLCFAFPVFMIGGIFGNIRLIEIGAGLGIISGIIVSAIYYRKLEYTVIMSVLFALVMFGMISDTITYEKEQSVKSKQVVENVSIEKSEKQSIGQEILEYGKKEYSEGYKYVGKVDVIEDSINIILNTDSELSDKNGSSNGEVLSIILSNATVYSCGDENAYDTSLWDNCKYNPRKINIFNKSGYHVKYFGHDTEMPLCYSSNYIAPEHPPTPYYEITSKHKEIDVDSKVRVGMTKKQVIEKLGKPHMESSPRSNLNILWYNVKDCDNANIYIENGIVTLIYDESKGYDEQKSFEAIQKTLGE